MVTTRREFIKDSLAALGFLALPGLPVFAAPALWKPAKKAKLEVVKCCQCGNVAKSNVVKSNVANTRLGLGIGTGNTGNTGKISIKIPMADGNAASRVYNYNVVVVGDDPKARLFKNVFFSGVNSGIGHEPARGVTTMEIPVADLPAGKKLTIAVRPVSSLGTKGKSIGTTWKA